MHTVEGESREQGTKQRPQKLNTSNFIESWLEATQSSQIFQRIYNRHSCAYIFIFFISITSARIGAQNSQKTV